MFKINLVPEVQEKKQKTAKNTAIITMVSISAVVVVAVALLVIGGIITTNKVMISNTEKKISETGTEVAKYAELEKTVLQLEKGLAEAKKIINGSNTWTRLFPHLEDATPNDVTYTSLSLEPGEITANLRGKDVNSLARFVTSYKAYHVLVIKGGTSPEGTVTVTVGSQTTNVPVKLDGSFIYAAKINPADDLTATVKMGDKEVAVNYTAENKTISSQDASVTADIKPLFTNVSVNQYSKSGEVTFDATINFDGGLLW